MNTQSDVPPGLEKHYKIRLDEKEIKAIAMCLEAFFEQCRLIGMKPPVQQTGYVLRALEKMNRALLVGPDLLTIEKKLVR